MFQSHFGSIKTDTSSSTAEVIKRFNPTLVRLKQTAQREFVRAAVGFNPTLVRLKLGFT